MADFEAVRDKIVSELTLVRPKGIRYTWWKHSDGVTFLGLLELEEGVVNPLPAMRRRKLQLVTNLL